MTGETLKEKKKEQDKKFYFNANIFDDDFIDEDEVEEEAPVFSEDELNQAKKRAFDEGRAQGLQEATESREQQVAKLLGVIAQDVKIFAQTETERSTVFEHEAVALSLAIFEKLYPLYEESYGFEELKQNLEKLLKTAHGQKEIAVTVCPDLTDGVQQALSDMAAQIPGLAFTVSGSDQIGPNACKMIWADGGAIIDREKLAGQIRATMEQTLAGGPTTRHDKEQEKEQETAKDADTEPQENSEQEPIAEQPDE